MISRKFEPVLTGLLLSGLMSLLVSGVSIFRLHGFTAGAGFLNLWFSSWLTAWLVAFPIVLNVAPLARRIAHQLTSER